jgi:hypothetical protein
MKNFRPSRWSLSAGTAEGSPAALGTKMKTERVIAGIFVVAQIVFALFLFGTGAIIKLSAFLVLMFVMVAIGSAGLDHPAGRGIRFIGWLGIVVPAAVLILNMLLFTANKQGRIVPNKASEATSGSAPSAPPEAPQG